MILLISTFLALSSPMPSDTVQVVFEDTLEEVEITHRERLGVMDAIDASLARNKQPRTKSLGEVLGKANDYITHPFGFKERRLQKQRKVREGVLNEYNRVKTFEELLDEAVKQQQAEDEKGK